MIVVLGWITSVVLILVGLAAIIYFAGPSVWWSLKNFSYKTKELVKVEKEDIDKRISDRRNRKDIKRSKDNELKQKKLDNKLHKIEKQIALQEQKKALALELKEKDIDKEPKKIVIKKEIKIKEELPTPENKVEEVRNIFVSEPVEEIIEEVSVNEEKAEN